MLIRCLRRLFGLNIHMSNDLLDYKQKITAMKTIAIDKKLDKVFIELAAIDKKMDEYYSRFLLTEANQTVTTNAIHDLRGDTSNVLREIRALMAESRKR